MKTHKITPTTAPNGKTRANLQFVFQVESEAGETGDGVAYHGDKLVFVSSGTRPRPISLQESAKLFSMVEGVQQSFWDENARKRWLNDVAEALKELPSAN